MNTLLVVFNYTSTDTKIQDNIVGHIKLQGSWARLSPNTWLVKTEKNSTQLRDDLMKYSSVARIAVINVTSDGWGTTYSNDVSNWMKDNI